MDDVYKNLEKQGKTDVENLIKWMKDSKIIESTKEQEIKARKMFQDVADKHHVELNQFKEVIAKIAVEQQKTVEQLSKQLAAEGPRILNAAITGLNAFKEALNAGRK